MHPPSLPLFSVCCHLPHKQDDVDADDGEDDDDADGNDEDEEYMKRLRKAALRMLKGEAGESEWGGGRRGREEGGGLGGGGQGVRATEVCLSLVSHGCRPKVLRAPNVCILLFPTCLATAHHHHHHHTQLSTTATGEEEDSDEWDEEDDDETIGTPLDDMDPFVSFTEVLAGVQGSMPARYSALMAGADANLTAALQAVSQHAAVVQAKKAAEAAQQQQ